jgi:cell division protein FtsN
MAKDYAKYNAKNRTRNKKNRSAGLFTVFLFLLLTIGIGYLIYANRQTIPTMIANVKTLIHHKKVTAQPVDTVKQNTPPPVHFAFYNELPKMQVPAANTVVEQKTIVKEKKSFTLNVGEFQNENDASQMRLSLLLLGVESDIIKVGETYKLQQGNYSTLALAKAAQKKLQIKGVDAKVEKNE